MIAEEQIGINVHTQVDKLGGCDVFVHRVCSLSLGLSQLCGAIKIAILVAIRIAKLL